MSSRTLLVAVAFSSIQVLDFVITDAVHSMAMFSHGGIACEFYFNFDDVSVIV